MQIDYSRQCDQLSLIHLKAEGPQKKMWSARLEANAKLSTRKKESTIWFCSQPWRNKCPSHTWLLLDKVELGQVALSKVPKSYS